MDDSKTLFRLWDLTLKKSERSYSDRFKSYFVMGLDAPGISWNLFTGDKLTQKDIHASEEHFKNSRAEVQAPFLSLISNHPSTESGVLPANDYVLESRLYNCFTSKVLQAGVPENVSVVEGSFEDPDIFDHYADMTIEIFNLSDRTIPEFNRQFNREMGVSARILNFKSGSDPVGTACYSLVGDICWLYGGSVYEKFRGRGVWKAMLRVRQEISAKQGAKVWFLQTAHSHLARYFETSVDFLNYRKKLKEL